MVGAEFAHGVQREMAMTLGDLLIRRTHLAFGTADQARALAPLVADLIQPWFGWSHRERDMALRDYDDEIEAVFSFA